MVRYTKIILKSLIDAIKAGIGAIKGTVALIIAGGAVAVILVIIICLAVVVGGVLMGNV